MLDDIRSDIIRYTEMLSREYGLSVTMHPTNEVLTAAFGPLFRYNVHQAPLCVFCKQDPLLRKRCTFTQRWIAACCRSGKRAPFTGACHAGIGCRIYPIYEEDVFLGYICANGLEAEPDTVIRRLRGLTQPVRPASDGKISELYRKSLLSMPEERLTDALMLPLPYLLGRLYTAAKAQLRALTPAKKPDVNMLLVGYLQQNSAESISADDLARRFHFSRSYISHMFRKRNGVSVSEYLTRLRLEKAVLLLTETELPVTLVASEVGFADANYFSKQFRKRYGVSPKQYRRERTGEEEPT